MNKNLHCVILQKAQHPSFAINLYQQSEDKAKNEIVVILPTRADSQVDMYVHYVYLRTAWRLSKTYIIKLLVQRAVPVTQYYHHNIPPTQSWPPQYLARYRCRWRSSATRQSGP